MNKIIIILFITPFIPFFWVSIIKLPQFQDVIILFKHQRTQHNAIQIILVKVFKKRRLKTTLFLNFEHLNSNNNKLSIIDTSNNKSDFAKPQIQNKSANKINSDFEKKDYNNIDEKDLEKKQFRIK